MINFIEYLGSTFTISVFFFFKDNYHYSCTVVALFTHFSSTVHVLFMGPTVTLFRKKY